MLLHDFLLKVYAPRRLGIAPQTIKQYGYAASSLSRYHSRSIDVTELTDDLLLPWLQQRLQEVSARSVKRERSDLMVLWRWACRHGYNSTPPVDIPHIHVPFKNPIAWEVDEFEQLVVAARGLKGTMKGTAIPKADWWSSLLLFLYWTAPRIVAALGVRTSEFSMRKRRVILRSETAKTRAEQILRLNDQVIAAVASHYDGDREFVWPYHYHPRRKWIQLKAILKRAGLPADRYRMFHCLRRTNYTLAWKYGGPDVANRQLGHRTDMSKHYLDRSQLDDIQAADVLPQPKF